MSSVRDARRSDGFTVVEVVIAAAILFVVLTGVLGLVGLSQNMSLGAKQRTILTNATAYYIDHVRSMPFQSIGIVGVDTSGTVPANDSITFGGYTVYFANSVAVFADSRGDIYLKELTLRATCTIAGKQYVNTATASIKNPRDNRTSQTLADPESPSIQFDDAVTPGPNEVLFGALRMSGGSIRIRTTATSPHDVITQVQYLSGSTLLFDPNANKSASFTFTPGTSSETNQAYWDTTQAGIGEGFQSIIVTAQDSQGRTVSLSRKFIIDNLAPEAPGAPIVTVSTDSSSTATWSAARDGNQSFGARYNWLMYREPLGNTAGVSPLNGWSQEPTLTVLPGSTMVQQVSNAGPIGLTFNHAPFSRYWVRVQAGSPRLWNASTYGTIAAPFITRPDVKMTTPYSSMSTTTITRTKLSDTTAYKATIWMSKPTFPCDASALANPANYTLSMWDPATSAWTTLTSSTLVVDTSDSSNIKVVVSYTESTSIARPIYFKVGLKVLPTGWSGGTMTGFIYGPAAGPAAVPVTPAQPTLKGVINTSALTVAIGQNWNL